MPRNILIISQLFYPDTFGGSERVVYEQARRLVTRGHAVTVLVQRDRAALPVEEIVDGIRVVRYGNLGLRRFFGRSITDLRDLPAALKKVVDGFTPEVVLLHHPFPAAAYFKTKISAHFYSIYLFHASVYRELDFDRRHGSIARSWFGKILALPATPLLLWWVRRTERTALERTHKILVLSQFSRTLLGETYPSVVHKVVDLPGGVDLELFAPKPSARALRTHLHIPEDADLLLTVRRLVPRMGLSLLIDAVARARQENHRLVCVIGGSGPEEARLKAEVKKRKLDYAVRFAGRIPTNQLADYYGAADLYVLPTTAYEGLGLTTLEAMASGLPVAATPVGATPEILSAVTPELLAADASALAITEVIVRFFTLSPEERQGLKGRVRKYAEAHWNWDHSMDVLESIIEQTLSGS